MVTESLDLVSQFLSNVAFPIAVTAFLLWRIENKLGALSESVVKNTDATNNLAVAVQAIPKEIRR